MKLFKGSADTNIYVVNEKYRIIYCNDVLKNAYPDIHNGDTCYKSLCGEKKPCENCPLKKKEGGKGILYNKYMRRWVEVDSGIIEWPGEGQCNIVFSKAIHEGNKSLFYNLADISAYDELFELDLSKDTYKILSHAEDKYVLPDEEGKITNLRREVAEHMVHPDDKELFAEFWDMESMTSRLMEADSEHTLSIQFRKKIIDGTYCWVLQTVVPLKNGSDTEQIAMCFIQDIDKQKKMEEQFNKQFDIDYKSKDELTGLYKRNIFFLTADKYLKGAESGEYCLMAIDIEHFKLFNEWYGQEEGDRFLISIGHHLKQAQIDNNGIAGYMGSDDFCIILPYDMEVLTKLQEQIQGYVKQYGGNAGFLPAFGMYRIEDVSVPLNQIYDRACIAISSVKGNYSRRACWYDERMMQKMGEDHTLLVEVQRALERQEFTFYAQPKCNLITGKIVGLESLVRWIHPERGVISPGEFIPVLEQNGFITELDLYIWESVCIRLRSWIDSGHRGVPISVNVSRVDIYTLDIVEVFGNLIEKYNIDPELLEIEITESAYVEEYQIISEVIEKLRNRGFTVLMDDFGSGYSSLNMLKDVNVDVLKIDMKFLEMGKNVIGKGRGILEAIIGMAQLMELRLIAEGVETKEQKDLLVDMGCLYAQGYYFYRPLSIPQLETLMEDEKILDYRGMKARQIERINVKELLNGGLISEAIVNNILGGVAFYDVCDGNIELLRVNEQYYKLVGTNPVDIEEHKDTMLDTIYEEDRNLILRIFQNAYEDPLHGSEGDVRRYKGDGSTMWMHLRAFFLKEQDNHKLYYGTIADVTEQKNQEKQLESSQKALSAAVHISNSEESFMRLAEDNRKAAAAIFAQMTPGGMIGGYCEEGMPLYFANYEMVNLLGYDTYEELSAGIDGKIINTVHPDDRQRILGEIEEHISLGYEYTTTYRMLKKDGSVFWTLDKGRIVCAEDGRLAIISVCSDISETMAIQQKLSENNRKLARRNQELNFLNNDMPGGYHRRTTEEGFELLYMSNRFLAIFGYTDEEIKQKFDNQFLNMVHPDDRIKVVKDVEYVKEDRHFNMEYRMRAKRGYIWVIEQSKYLEYDGKGFIQGVVLDVTETVELRNKMKMLMMHTPETIFLAHWKENGLECQMLVNGLARNLGISSLEYGSRLGDEAYEEYDRCFLKETETAMKEGRNYHCIKEMLLPDGKEAWIDMDARYVGETGKEVTYLCRYANVTSLKKKEQEFWLLSQKMESILRQAGVNSWEWDMENHVLFMTNVKPSQRVEKVFRKLENGGSFVTNFPECVASFKSVPEEYRKKFSAYLAKFQAGEAVQSTKVEVPAISEDGETVWLQIACETIRNDNGTPIKAVGYYIDITEQKNEFLKSKESIRALEIDSLTGLYNRQTAIPKIRDYLCKMPEGETAALIMFDLDNFKLANDVFGHIYGDTIIAENARKLREFFRDKDIVCRMGGDEFLVLCKSITAESIDKKLNSIIKEMIFTYPHKEREITFSLSAGYAMIPEMGRTFEELYERADVALFSAKLSGKSFYKKYDSVMKTVRYELAGECNAADAE